MKLIVTLLMAVFAFNTVNAKEKMITEAELPKNARTFLKEHFSTHKIISVTEEREDFFWKEYKVFLAGGNVVEFNSKGEWKEIKTTGQMPASIVPQAITEHLRSNFPAEQVCKIKKDRSGYEVELLNGLDVKFNKEMQYIGLDD